MKRRSDRGKTKVTPKEESPEKTARKTHKHSRRRRKSSSSSDDSKSPKKDVENISQPLDVKLQDIELPQGDNPVAVSTNDSHEGKPNEPENAENEWKEDSSFWESETPKPTEEPTTEETEKEKEESSMWKVQSANGAGGGGEIQKLKICRQKPTDSPELGDASLRKRLSRGPRDSRSTDDSAHEESEKDSRKSKHRSRTSSSISTTVVCDMSEDSPTKIKIINVSHINVDSKGGNVKKAPNEGEDGAVKTDFNKEISIVDQSLDIALPSEQPPPLPPTEKVQEEQNTAIVEKEAEQSVPDNPELNTSSKEVNSTSPEPITKEDNLNTSTKKSSSVSPSPSKDGVKSHSSRSSSVDSNSSEDKSKPRKVKKKRRRELQSSVQRKLSTSASPTHESSDSEDAKEEKKEEDLRESSDVLNTKEIVNDKENEADNSLPPKDNAQENNVKEEQVHRPPMPRKRRWGSSKANRPNKKPILNISTDSLKSLIPDAKPVPAEELQLSVEEEEGQLDDDDDDDEVVYLVAKEEEKQLERERQIEERQKEKAKEVEERRKRQERKEKSKPEHPPHTDKSEKGAASRKILLLTDDAKKLARSPSPPRHKPTSVLFITHLVRPFTVQQLKNLLLRTGTIAENGFWIDKIKSKCYVEYTTEDAAVETRHALHGVRWPISNPKTLVVEFASHGDLVIAQALSEEPEGEVPRKVEPLNMVEGWVADQARIKERNRRAPVREWDVGKPEHPDEVLDYDLKMKEKRDQERKSRKERTHRSDTPDAEPPARKSRRKEEDAPAKLLDDLFRKTKSSPCIYWLPLTQEQIAVKEEIRRQHMAEHERRMAELKKAELARRDRERRNRK